MTSASAVGERLVRLLLLALTVLGVAALHTLGHAAITGPEQHSRVPAVASLTPVLADQDGCAGDGCDHRSVMPIDNGQGSRWWETCLAVLSILAAGIFAVALSWHTRTAAAGGAGPRRPPPRAARTLPLGLTLATVAVLRT